MSTSPRLAHKTLLGLAGAMRQCRWRTPGRYILVVSADHAKVNRVNAVPTSNRAKGQKLPYDAAVHPAVCIWPPGHPRPRVITAPVRRTGAPLNLASASA